MSSLNRKGIFKVPLAYRFASYRYDTREPQHVFAVLYPNTKNEVWIDPVLNKFDQRKEPVFIKDKKIKMALISMSGTSTQVPASLQEMENYRDKLVGLKNKYLNSGVITPGSQEENQYIMAIDKVTKFIQKASISGTTDDEYGTIEVSSSKIDWSNIFGKLVDTGASLIQRNNQPSGGGFFPTFQQSTPTMTQSQGINLNTILLVGGAGLGLYLILRKR